MANDTGEMLEAAQAEVVRIEKALELAEKENAQLRAYRTPEEVEARIRRESIISAAEWLDGLRDETWNGGLKKPSNYHRAANDLRRHAFGVR